MNDHAQAHVRSVVVANPSNTLTSVLAHNAPRIYKSQFTGLSRLDQNRARSIIARKCHVTYKDVKNVLVWGNHSNTQYTDVAYCTILGLPATDFIKDKNWLEGEFVNSVANRAFEIRNYRGKSAVTSTAVAIVDHLRDWFIGSKELAVKARVSDGQLYGVDAGLTFSVPNICKGNFEVEVAELLLSDFAKMKLATSHEQLSEEWANAIKLMN